MKPVKALVIHEDGREEMIEVEPSLDVLQGIVGGFIEFVFVWEGVHAYVDEEGKIKGKPVNLKATRMCRLAPGDYIAGPAIFLGSDPDAPAEEGDLPEEWRQTAPHGSQE